MTKYTFPLCAREATTSTLPMEIFRVVLGPIVKSGHRPWLLLEVRRNGCVGLFTFFWLSNNRLILVLRITQKQIGPLNCTTSAHLKGIVVHFFPTKVIYLLLMIPRNSFRSLDNFQGHRDTECSNQKEVESCTPVPKGPRYVYFSLHRCGTILKM